MSRPRRRCRRWPGRLVRPRQLSRRRLRLPHSWVLAAALALVAAMLVVPAAPAHATIVCQERLTPYHWTQQSCLEWAKYGGVTGMWGTGQVQLLQGFNRGKVKYCTAYLQLKSSYGSLSPAYDFNCSAEARRGGQFAYPATPWGPYRWDWGPGRRPGDTYTQYTWMEVWTTTGGHYDSRSQAAQTTIIRP